MLARCPPAPLTASPSPLADCYAISPSNRAYSYTELAVSSLLLAVTIANTHYACLWRDGHAELALVAWLNVKTASRQSPILVLTGLIVGQLCWCAPWMMLLINRIWDGICKFTMVNLHCWACAVVLYSCLCFYFVVQSIMACDFSNLGYVMLLLGLVVFVRIFATADRVSEYQILHCVSLFMQIN